MNTNRIFEGEVFSNNEKIGTSVFLKTGEKFVLLDDINTTIDLIKLDLNINNGNILIFDTDNSKKYYIDENTLVPYYEKEKQKTLRKIKLDFLCDSRNPGGIEY